MFSSSKSHMHMFNMLVTSVQSFQIDHLITLGGSEFITQTGYSILKPNLKIKNAVILSKLLFSKKSHAHLQYACNNCAKIKLIA